MVYAEEMSYRKIFFSRIPHIVHILLRIEWLYLYSRVRKNYNGISFTENIPLYHNLAPVSYTQILQMW